MLRDYVDRLVACGMDEPAAMRICGVYASWRNYSGLEEFVHMSEIVFDDRKEYAMEDR